MQVHGQVEPILFVYYFSHCDVGVIGGSAAVPLAVLVSGVTRKADCTTWKPKDSRSDIAGLEVRGHREELGERGAGGD